MTTEETQIPVASGAPLKALFGFTEPDGIDWGPIRALQLRPLHGHQLIRIGLDITLATLAASLFFLTTPKWILGLWVVALSAFDFYSYRTPRKTSGEWHGVVIHCPWR